MCLLLTKRSVHDGPITTHDIYLKERFLSFIFLFVLSFFCYLHFLVFFFSFFGLSAFFPSAFYYPNFSIRIRHPQVSGPRITDTPLISAVTGL